MSLFYTALKTCSKFRSSFLVFSFFVFFNWDLIYHILKDFKNWKIHKTCLQKSSYTKGISKLDTKETCWLAIQQYLKTHDQYKAEWHLFFFHNKEDCIENIKQISKSESNFVERCCSNICNFILRKIISNYEKSPIFLEFRTRSFFNFFTQAFIHNGYVHFIVNLCEILITLPSVEYFLKSKIKNYYVVDGIIVIFIISTIFMTNIFRIFTGVYIFANVIDSSKYGINEKEQGKKINKSVQFDICSFGSYGITCFCVTFNLCILFLSFCERRLEERRIRSYEMNFIDFSMFGVLLYEVLGFKNMNYGVEGCVYQAQIFVQRKYNITTSFMFEYPAFISGYIHGLLASLVFYQVFFDQ